ncbi:MAG: putative adenylate/guanylate cyclase [Chthoniobacteraceae bacterium]|nr:putative adenylate/guanylate cyclase [Chthoniobacteraceae bacterium]
MVVYLQASAAAVVVVFFLVFLGLEFNSRQWLVLFTALPFATSLYGGPDVFMIRRHFKPLGKVLGQIDRGETPPRAETSAAIVRALNLPYYSFLRVILFHGPGAALSVVIALVLGNVIAHAGFQTWQIAIFSTIVLFFASPTHGIFEFFAVSKSMTNVIERLYPLVGTLDPESQAALKYTGLRKKLLYLAIFVTALPLLFLAASVTFKLGLLLSRSGVNLPPGQIFDLMRWVYGVVVLCVVGAFILSLLTASEVSRSAAKLIAAMNQVEGGNLEGRLQITSTDEYADLYRGFNLMTAGLREEVEILGISHDLMGELKLEVLLERIMRATTGLLDADRSTLFLFDSKTNELWSRFAEGLASREIRINVNVGIAGAAFTTGKVENIADAHLDPRFNAEVDRRTGYHTKTVLAVPVINKAGARIGVTQVLNKRGGVFTARDESRLRAFTAQIAVALENAKLFDDVMRMQNYNESILRSTSNGMITLDNERRVVTANAATLKLLKVTSANIVGAEAGTLFAAPNDWVLDSLAKVEATGETDLAVDAELQLPSGEIASANLTSVPLIDANQQKIGSMLILEDITDEKRIKSTMSRYMSKEVADQLLQSGETVLGGQVQRVSILFSDIRDFTTVSEAIGARETVSMLNEYFAEMVDVIFRHSGILDKYIGDAIMALFGAPFHGAQDADNAVRVANDMIVTLRALNAVRTASGHRPIDIGVGVNTGEAVVGSIGSPKRMEYTAIGDSVNLASRLEGACKTYGVKVLVSEFTLGALTHTPRIREIDFMRVKGKQQPVAIFEGLDHHTSATFPNMDQTVENFSSGLKAYRSRDWKTALTCLETALQFNPHDKPSRIYRERCLHFLDAPPDNDWDRVWVLKEK